MSDRHQDEGNDGGNQPNGTAESGRSFTTETIASDILSTLAKTPWKVAIVLTGGGTGVIGRCFARSGASTNFIEGLVPYSREAVIDYLGKRLSGSSASVEASEQLAQKAYERAQRLSPSDGCDSNSAYAGLALVAALPTTPPRRGSDRIHVSLITASAGKTWTIELPRGEHTRKSSEEVAEQLALIGLASLTECEDLSQRLIRCLAERGITVIERAGPRSPTPN